MTPTPLAPTVALPIPGTDRDVPIYTPFTHEERAALVIALTLARRTAVLALPRYDRPGCPYWWQPVVRGVVGDRYTTYPAAAAVLAEFLS
jgi:hypothetical protein